MNLGKQVDKSHYEFQNYLSKERWSSLWHQLDEVIQLKPEKVLEIGPGPGVFKQMALLMGVSVETLDLDPELRPDHIGSATALPFVTNAYDVVCAFQMLEHLPYDVSLIAFNEMVRISQRYVVISLPDARSVWRYQLHIPGFGMCNLLVPRPQLRAKEHKFDGEHYWELNKRGYRFNRIISDFSQADVQLIKTYRVQENPYHRFFLFKKSRDNKNAACSE